MSRYVTALTNVGPGLGPIIGPVGNFSSLPDSSKWILSFGMPDLNTACQNRSLSQHVRRAGARYHYILGVISGELFIEVVWQSDASCLEDVAQLAGEVSSGCDDATILFDGGFGLQSRRPARRTPVVKRPWPACGWPGLPSPLGHLVRMKLVLCRQLRKPETSACPFSTAP
jgi:hypothetical protein